MLDFEVIPWIVITLVILFQHFYYFKPGNVFGYTIAIFLALFVMDLISGLAHMFLDRYDGEDPFIKPLAEDFQRHHDNPGDFAILETNIGVIREFLKAGRIFTIPGLVWIFLIFVLKDSPFISYFTLFSLLWWITGPVAQVSHRLSHVMVHDPPPKNSTYFIVLNFLQKNGVLLNPEFHKKHHKINDKHWPVFNGWSSNLIDFLFE